MLKLHAPARWFSLALVLGALLVACQGGASSGGGFISSQEAHTLVDQGATLLDVRSDAEWNSGHLEGAKHIPIDQLASRIAELPRDKPVVAYCGSGVRSGKAVTLLKEAGYDARNLGGMSRWLP